MNKFILLIVKWSSLLMVQILLNFSFKFSPTADAGPVIKSAVAPPTTPTAPPTPTPTQTAPALPADLVGRYT